MKCACDVTNCRTKIRMHVNSTATGLPTVALAVESWEKDLTLTGVNSLTLDPNGVVELIRHLQASLVELAGGQLYQDWSSK